MEDESRAAMVRGGGEGEVKCTTSAAGSPGGLLLAGGVDFRSTICGYYYSPSLVYELHQITPSKIQGRALCKSVHQSPVPHLNLISRIAVEHARAVASHIVSDPSCPDDVHMTNYR